MIPFSVVSPMLLGLFYDWRGDYYAAVMLLAVLTTAGIASAFLLRLPPSPTEQTSAGDEDASRAA